MDISESLIMTHCYPTPLQGLAPVCESYHETTEEERFEILAEDEEYENGEKTPTTEKFLQHFCEYSRILQEVGF